MGIGFFPVKDQPCIRGVFMTRPPLADSMPPCCPYLPFTIHNHKLPCPDLLCHLVPCGSHQHHSHQHRDSSTPGHLPPSILPPTPPYLLLQPLQPLQHRVALRLTHGLLHRFHLLACVVCHVGQESHLGHVGQDADWAPCPGSTEATILGPDAAPCALPEPLASGGPVNPLRGGTT